MAQRETTNGDLRTPVVFYEPMLEAGLHGRDAANAEVFRTFAMVYGPSLKDVELATGKGVKASLTIKIRDPLDTYAPKNNHFVEVIDRRMGGQKLGIVDIRPAFDERDFLVIVLGGGKVE
ncbi:TPA: phage head-tail adapter protein [Streptococcus suis]